MNHLSAVLSDPGVVRSWQAEDWNRFLPLARNARLLGRCVHLFEARGLLDVVPQRIVDQLSGVLRQTAYVQGQARRELREVKQVLDAEGIPLMALKGLGYLVAGLPPSGWRSLSDIDLLVSEADLARAEQALRRAGWIPSGDYDAYDQRYYRDWMHEVPPMRHRARLTEVDLHHNLAPPVSRIRIDAGLLWADAPEVEDPTGLAIRVLAPADMLLHNAIHLFMNDELRGGLRDVVDFRDLFQHFAAGDAEFEPRLLARAGQLGCGRALYYAVTTAGRLAGLVTAPDFRAGLQRHAPPAPVGALMGWLIDRLLAPRRPGTGSAALAEQLLFIRSHWIRMPPGMLLRHLVHKLVRGRKPAPVATSDLPG